MAASQPRTPALVKARHLKAIIDAVRLLPATRRDAVLARIPTAILVSIDDSIGVEWLPVAVDVEMTRAIQGALGAKGASTFWRRLQLGALRSPLYKSLVEGARSLFSGTPGAYARWIPTGWDLVFRGCGRWSVAQEQHGVAVLRGEDLPAECLCEPAWVDAVVSSFSALLGTAELLHLGHQHGGAMEVACRRALER